MEVFEYNQIWEWYREHGTRHKVQSDGGDTVIPTLTEFVHKMRFVYDLESKPVSQIETVTKCLNAVGSWNTCLAVLTLWGIWPSGEDWPRFYAWRGRHKVKGSLNKGPGHFFLQSEASELRELLSQAFEFGWEGYIFFSSQASSFDSVIFFCHDGWLEMMSNKPFMLDQSAAH